MAHKFQHESQLFLKSVELAKQNANRLGLNLVSKPSDRKPIVNIVFIHGLGGKCHDTWAYKKKLTHFWPLWLQSEYGLANVQVYTFGYNSSIRPSIVRDVSCIEDFAEQLLAQLKFEAAKKAESVAFGEVYLYKAPII